MPLPSGARLGAYEIKGPIGSGGMGEVYRAHDARLGRDVAIKVLPSSLTRDPASLARFEREAKAIGALNHPNIVNVYDAGTHEGVTFVVMELLEGETLRARLQGAGAHTTTPSTKTPKPGSSGGTQAYGLPRKKALDIAHQIAQGLAAAHARGIVHRDLKPENVFLTNDGRVKILDFGLARAVATQIADEQTQLSPAPSSDSVPGMVLGTVGYMAPEQVRGQAADHRADIFAFGAVLYEMLTGERAFDCETPIETMSAILKADPLEQPVAAVAISGPLEPLVRHCLEKQPDERFQSARDLAFQLQAIASGSISTSTVERTVGAGARGGEARRWLVLGAVAAAALIAGVAIDRAILPAPASETSLTLALLPPPNVRIWSGASPARTGGVAVSRDGRQIAFVGWSGSGAPQIYVRSLDAAVARAVPGTENGFYPAWSPDGRRLAFGQAAKLKTIPVEGGAPQVVTDFRNPRSAAAWGGDDTLLYHPDYRMPLMRVPAAGGTPTEVLPIAAQDVSWFSPIWLPDGRRFLVVRFAYADNAAAGAGIYLGTVDSKETTLLAAGAISEVAVGDHEIFYRRATDLMAQPFDPRTAKLSGEPRVLSNHVSMVGAGGATLAYFDPPGGLSQGHRINIFSRTGTVLSQVGDVGTFRDPRLSPDGRHLAIARAGDTGLFSIWTYDLARNIDARVSGTTFIGPTWTRDGAGILSARTDGLRVFDLGGAPPRVIRSLPDFANVNDVTPDGREALLSIIGPEITQLASLALDGKSEPRPIGSGERGSNFASISPDGKWIAMVGSEGTARRLFVRPYHGAGPRIAVTGGVASYPRWRGDGRELYFAGGTGPDSSIMAVPVAWTASGPDFGAPQALFKVTRPIFSNHGFDVSSDGQRFVIVVAGDLDPSPITVRVRVKTP
jgi:Tol biopolymer transport system component/tRNA A-37 threonylcarbamoyl transferase component Bud32